MPCAHDVARRVALFGDFRGLGGAVVDRLLLGRALGARLGADAAHLAAGEPYEGRLAHDDPIGHQRLTVALGRGIERGAALLRIVLAFACEAPAPEGGQNVLPFDDAMAGRQMQEARRFLALIVQRLADRADEKLGLQEVAKYYYPAGFHEPGAALSVATNLGVWNDLTPQQQKAIEIASLEAHQYTYGLYIGNNGPALARLKAAGVQVGAFTDDVWDAFGAGTKEVLGEYMGDEVFKKIFDSCYAGMSSASQWMSVSDSTYTAQRARVFNI